MWPINVNGIWVDRMGKPWEPAPDRHFGTAGRHRKPAPTDPCICTPFEFKNEPRLDPDEAQRRTRKSQTYWTAYRAGQAAKREANIPYKPPAWSGERKKISKRRQWIPGEHAPQNKSGK